MAKWTPLTKGAWTGINYWSKGSGVRIDPYMIWADATAFADLPHEPDPIEWVPILMELRKKATDFAAKVAGVSWIKISPLYTHPAKGLEESRYCTAIVKKRFFSELGTFLINQYVERFELGYPVIVPSDTSPARRTTSDRGAVAPVVVGVIDNGMAFAHRRFRIGDESTRVEYFWSQDGSSASPVFYGAEWKKADIVRWMRSSMKAGLVNEDDVYRLAGYREVGKRITHGTHVMDVACGEEPSFGAKAPKIICVELPGRPNRGGMPLGVHILDGLRYIIDRADQLAGKGRTSPIVVNLSYGNIAGPHDGSTILERAIDELIDLRSKHRLAVVMAAGNSHLSRCHASFKVGRARPQQELTWRIPPDCRTASFLEIWLPQDAPSNAIELEIVPPNESGTSGSIKQGQVVTWTDGGQVLCTVVSMRKPANGASPVLVVAVAPTLANFKRSVAPAGNWSLRVKNISASELEVNAWIQRNDPPFAGLPYGRPSRFEDKNYQVYDYAGRQIVRDNGQSHVVRDGTISGIATGARPIVIGSFRRTDGAPANYSARGFGGRNPDAMATGDDMPASAGIRAAGTRSGSTFAMFGTSASVPQIVRWAAEQMANGAAVSRATVQNEADMEEQRRQSASANDYGGRPDPNLAGQGRIYVKPVTRAGR